MCHHIIKCFKSELRCDDDDDIYVYLLLALCTIFHVYFKQKCLSGICLSFAHLPYVDTHDDKMQLLIFTFCDGNIIQSEKLLGVSSGKGNTVRS